MDFKSLRRVIEPIIARAGGSLTHGKIESYCADLKLAAPPPVGEGSKADRLAASLSRTEDIILPTVANELLQKQPLSTKARFELQDLLWSDIPALQIKKRSRHEISKALESVDLFLNRDGFERLLDSLWKLEEEDSWTLMSPNSNSLREQIERHVFNNPGDWSIEYLFEQLGAFESSDQRFVRFLEGLVSHEVRPDEQAQQSFVSCLNPILNTFGVEFRETGERDGYPVFRLVPLGSPLLRPKNIIFASSIKPDLRIIDALNNDIEIVTNEDKVLVYDLPLTSDGLKWRDLQKWYKDSQNIHDDKEAKIKLYRRLESCLPENSPPQQAFFDAYHKCFGAKIPNLPALLPEVWLHWDPVTVKKRGAQALLNFRMDFLMLLPNGYRIVMEIDGKHHYADKDDNADANLYSKMVAADRELKLVGYEVFRFGTTELKADNVKDTTKTFFESLFTRYGVTF